MATATSYIPVELYLASDYEPDAEYVDGVIEERPAGELDHAMGIPQIWLVDPGTRKYYRFADGKPAAATEFGSAADRIHFNMAEIEGLLPKSSE